VPESPGEPYQTTTDADGSYSYSVPEGDYQILAEYYPNDEPRGGVYLEPMNGDGSVERASGLPAAVLRETLSSTGCAAERDQSLVVRRAVKPPERRRM
jgi:hypothetical protein